MSAPRKDLVLWFDDLRNIDVSIVGGKNASLGSFHGIDATPRIADAAPGWDIRGMANSFSENPVRPRGPLGTGNAVRDRWHSLRQKCSPFTIG